MLPLVCAAAVIVCAAEPGVSPEAAAWVKQHAIPFATSEAGHGFEDLKPLGAMIGDARIVSLGEPTHGTREAFQMKHRLLEYLVEERGFSIFSIEANMPEAYALNEYVIEGKGDPKQLIAGMYFWTWRTEEVLAMVEWMKTWNQTNPPESGKPRLQFTGFDMQTPTVAQRIAEDFLAAHDPQYLESVRPSLARLSTYNPYDAGADSFGCATGKLPVDQFRGKKVLFKGWIKGDQVKDGWAGLWWRVDGPAPFFDNMAARGVVGTTDWEERRIEVTVPEDAEAIFFGLVMPGSGKAWFDSLTIEVDGKAWSHPSFDLGFERPQPDGIISADPMRRRPFDNYPGMIDEGVAHAGKSSFRLERIEKPGLSPAEADAISKGIVDHMIASRETYMKSTDSKSIEWAVQNARIVHQWTRLGSAARGGYVHRDQCMADNIQWILEQNPGAKMVVWAHNGHVSRGRAWGHVAMGSFLTEKFPNEMIVFGFATARGFYTAFNGEKLASDNPLLEAPPASVESVLDSAGLPRLMLDIRGATRSEPGTAWAATSVPMRSIGAVAMAQQFFPIVPKEHFDVLVWQAETAASVSLPR